MNVGAVAVAFAGYICTNMTDEQRASYILRIVTLAYRPELSRYAFSSYSQCYTIAHIPH